MSFLLLLQPDGLANFAVAFFCLSCRDWKGVRGARISGTTHSLEPFSEPEARGKAPGFWTEESSGWCFWKASQVFLKCGRGSISRWFPQSIRASIDALTLFVCFMWVSVWFPESLRGVVYIPPKCFNQKMNKNDDGLEKGPKQKHDQIFFRRISNSKSLSRFFSVSFGSGKRTLLSFAGGEKNHRDPIRLRRNFLKVKKMTTPKFRVFC